MARPTLRTARLELRPLTTDHTELLVELDGDAAVTAHLTGRAATRAEVVDIWMPQRTLPEHDAMGLGYWSAFEGATFVGWFLLTPREPGAAEIGYRLRRQAWGRGLATEGAEAVMAHGFGTVGVERICAETMAVNTESRAVLARLGMRHVRTEVRQGDEPLRNAELAEAVFELTAAEYAASHP